MKRLDIGCEKLGQNMDDERHVLLSQEHCLQYRVEIERETAKVLLKNYHK